MTIVKSAAYTAGFVAGVFAVIKVLGFVAGIIGTLVWLIIAAMLIIAVFAIVRENMNAKRYGTVANKKKSKK